MTNNTSIKNTSPWTKPFAGLSLQRLTAIGFLLALIAIFSFLNGNFLSAGNIQNVLVSASVLLVVSCGAAFIILMGSIDLSVGAVATLAAMLCASLLPDIGYWSILVALAGAVAVGLINGTFFVYLRIPSILVTLGTATSLVGVILFISDGSSIAIRDQSFQAISNGTTILGIPNVILISLLIFLVLIHIAAKSRFGRMTLAIGSDEAVASLVGVKTDMIKIQAFALSALLAGISGILLASRLGNATATMGNFMMLETITAVVVGGTAISGGFGGVRLTLLGVAVISILSNGMNLIALHPYVQEIVNGTIIIAAVLLMQNRVSAQDVK